MTETGLVASRAAMADVAASVIAVCRQGHERGRLPVPAEILTAAGLLRRTASDLDSAGEVVPRLRSTAQIATQLWITSNTVHDHLNSVYEKPGVRSRREVMARILREHYLPGLSQSRPISPTRYFV